MCFLYQTLSPTAQHIEDIKNTHHARARDVFPPIMDRRKHFPDGPSTCVLRVEKLFDGAGQLGDVLEAFDQISVEGEDVGEVPHQPQLRFLKAGVKDVRLRPASSSCEAAALTFCRNLQSTGTPSFPSFSSTMWVRLCREIFSLQLHTAEQWMGESLGTEAKNRRGSPTRSIMTGLAQTRESAWIREFTSFSCRFRCCGGDDE